MWTVEYVSPILRQLYYSIFVEVKHTLQNRWKKYGKSKKERTISVCLRRYLKDSTKANMKTKIVRRQYFYCLYGYCLHYFHFHSFVVVVNGCWFVLAILTMARNIDFSALPLGFFSFFFFGICFHIEAISTFRKCCFLHWIFDYFFLSLFLSSLSIFDLEFLMRQPSGFATPPSRGSLQKSTLYSIWIFWKSFDSGWAVFVRHFMQKT